MRLTDYFLFLYSRDQQTISIFPLSLLKQFSGLQNHHYLGIFNIEAVPHFWSFLLLSQNIFHFHR